MNQLAIGQRVLITGKKHPWRTHAGEIVVGLQKPSIRILPEMYTVQLDNGSRCMAKPSDLKAQR